ncbi:MAG: acyclic terpene utilization AtuA family protein [Candidimonas sp.]
MSSEGGFCMKDVVRVGCGSGFWGDTPEGARQLIKGEELDYLILDYLAEVTMSILARMKSRNPALGYVPDFIDQIIKPYAKDIARRRLKVIVNAGGVNPRGCADAVCAELASQGVDLKVAAILGDDVMGKQDRLMADKVTEMFSGETIPDDIVSANAYIGAFPIARALREGADIVVTGRCVDSALGLGPLIHEFGWRGTDWDQLSAGSLLGHVLECGPQVTGGFETDWEKAKDTWASIGFPVAECRRDGTFVVTKPLNTGGAVTLQGVAEQITYETGDPAAYVLPDVVCDWRNVGVRQVGVDRVMVEGAVGRPATGTYKVCATYQDGFRCIATLLVRGRDAVAKSRAIAHAILQRTRNVFEREGLKDYAETSIECIGSEEVYGASARTSGTREVMLKIGARHGQKEALEIFSREIYPASTGTVQGIAGVFGGRPKIQPVVRLFSFLLDKREVDLSILTNDKKIDLDRQAVLAGPGAVVHRNEEAGDREIDADDGLLPDQEVPLLSLAYARSGDKGDRSNIAVLARRPDYLPLLRRQLTEERVKDYMAHLVRGEVRRYEWPGLHGFNFLMDEALGGGGVASLRYDPQGKAHAQILLDFPIRVPRSWVVDGMVEAI